MSDVSMGQGWWVASNGKWYPPHLHPDAKPIPPPPTPLSAPTSVLPSSPFTIHQPRQEFSLPQDEFFRQPIAGQLVPLGKGMSTKAIVLLVVGAGVFVLPCFAIAIPTILGTEGAISDGTLTNLVPVPTAATPSWNGPGFSVAFTTNPTRQVADPNGVSEVIWNDVGMNPTHGEYIVSEVTINDGGSIANSSDDAVAAAGKVVQTFSDNPSVTTVEPVTPIQVGYQAAAIFAVSGPVSIFAGSNFQIPAALSGFGNKPVVGVFEVIPEGGTLYVVGAQGVGTQVDQIPGGSTFLSSFQLSDS